MYFPQISNKRVPSSVQKSQKQARPRPKHGSPPPPAHPSDSPFILRGRQNYLSTSRETPASSVCHPIPPINRRPPPSRRSRYPDIVVQRNRNRNSLKEQLKPRQSCLHDADADVRCTRTTPTTPSCASLLRLHCRNRPPHRSCSRYAVVRRLGSASPPPTDGHRTTLNILAMGSSKAAPSSKTLVPPAKRRKFPRHMEDTTPTTENGTPLPLFVQILRLYSHRIHPTKETS